MSMDIEQSRQRLFEIILSAGAVGIPAHHAFAKGRELGMSSGHIKGDIKAIVDAGLVERVLVEHRESPNGRRHQPVTWSFLRAVTP